MTAVDDADEDVGESVLIEFKPPFPQGVSAGARPSAVVQFVDDEGGTPGELRLVGADGVPTSTGEGRLEAFHNGRWGTVCDDRFEGSFNIYDRSGNVARTVDNHAPAVACNQMGYKDGTVIRNAPYRLDNDNDLQPIWLDDVRCEKGGTHANTGQPHDRLDRCYHAGIGRNNCTHAEDVALRCGDAGEGQELDCAADTTTVCKVPVGGSATGKRTNGDIDWFRVQFQAGRTYEVSLPEPLRDSAVTLTDPKIEGIYDHNGNFIGGTVNDDFPFDDGLDEEVSSRVNYTATRTGVHYIAVSGASPP